MYWTLSVYELTRICDISDDLLFICDINQTTKFYEIKACAISEKYAHDSKGNECNVALDVYIINILK